MLNGRSRATYQNASGSIRQDDYRKDSQQMQITLLCPRSATTLDTIYTFLHHTCYLCFKAELLLCLGVALLVEPSENNLAQLAFSLR